MARIDTSAIEGYEGMTPEERLAALESYEYEDNSDELQALRNAKDKAAREAAEWKRKHNALLSEEDRKKAERDEELEAVRAERDALRKEKAISSNEARLLGMGYDAELARATAEAIVGGDTETFYANHKKFLEAHDKAYKAELMKKNLEPGGGDPPAPKTREEILSIKDPIERQQAIADNLELFQTS